VALRPIVPCVYAVRAGVANAFVIDDEELTLVDTGVPGSADRILNAVRALGRRPEEVRHILVTHCHRDHAGSLAALQRATGAATYMHPLDAGMVERGRSMRPVHSAPGLVPRVARALLMRGQPPEVEPARIRNEVLGGDEIPAAGGMLAIHAPGHCAGQLAFLWPHHGGVLFAADTAAHVFGLGLSIVYENQEEGERTLARLGTMDFDVACFGHGRPLVGGASAAFAKRWPARG